MVFSILPSNQSIFELDFNDIKKPAEQFPSPKQKPGRFYNFLHRFAVT